MNHMKKSLLLSLLAFSIFLSNISLSQTVFVTKSGKKFHTEQCRYINYNSISIELNEAIDRGYSPCKVCNPLSGMDSYNILPNDDRDTKDHFFDQKEIDRVQCSAITKKEQDAKE